MKLISWNVNGLRACLQKGFLETFQTLDADIFCLQETKLQHHAGQVDLDCRGTTSSGTARRRRAIPGWRCSPRQSPCR